jgi:hypothetical protein
MLFPSYSLWFKSGRDDEPVVLCTDTATFAVKNVDISNAMLLIAPTDAEPAHVFSGAPKTIVGQVKSYIELVPMAPLVGRSVASKQANKKKSHVRILSASLFVFFCFFIFCLFVCCCC